MTPLRASCARAFTLIEVMVVVIIMSILAVTVVPAMQNLDETRRGAAHDELARMLNQARSLAMASGEPHGLALDVNAENAQIVAIQDSGEAPTPANDPMGNPLVAVSLQDLYDGVEIVSVTHGDGSTGSGTIWFRFDGTPQIRDLSGSLVSAFSQNARVELSGARTLTVHLGTGMVESP